MKHALVIGGTGMLANVSLWLVENNYHVSIVARNPLKMERVINKAADKSRITPLYVDYENDDDLRKIIAGLIEKSGPVELMVAWIHTTAKKALSSIVDIVANPRKESHLYHILGSSSNLSEIKQNLSVKDHCHYHQVQLGFIIENGSSRWLTNDEIASGVIEAIGNSKEQYLVGQLEPWDKRP
jgi:hypothetical protein